jgi:hypothetical protein
MPRISLFVEDFGHEVFLKALIERFTREYHLPVTVKPCSVRGGFGKVEKELAAYVNELIAFREHLPDLLIVATDSNCDGYKKRKDRLLQQSELIKDRVLFAIPDPHIEKWLLLDPAAFRDILGKACKTPTYKCDRNRYKRLLIDAVMAAGATPILSGLEYTEDIVNKMNFNQLELRDESLWDLIKQLHSKFKIWSQSSCTG